MAAFTVSDHLSFEDSLGLTQAWLDQVEQEQVEPSDLEAGIAALVQQENGARGFFVTYLTDDRPLVETVMSIVVAALKTAPLVVAPLLVKNLAMSTAMAITHRRNQDESQAQGSDRVQQRSLELIHQVGLDAVQEQLRQLVHSIDTGTGSYQNFLQRWGYDQEQQQTIRQVVEQLDLR